MQERQNRAYRGMRGQGVPQETLVIKGILGGQGWCTDTGDVLQRLQMALVKISRLTPSSRDPGCGKTRRWPSFFLCTFDKDRDPS